MTPQQDIRWQQRFYNYQKALAQFRKFIQQNHLNELEEQGLIKAFEYTYELAWTTIKDFYENQGETNIQGSRDAIQMAFERGLISNGTLWMQMLLDRNKTSHTYNEHAIQDILKVIRQSYFPLFEELELNLKSFIK